MPKKGKLVHHHWFLLTWFLALARLVNIATTDWFELPPVSVAENRTQQKQEHVIKKAELSRCYLEANTKHIREKSLERRKAKVPLFTSIVRTPRRADEASNGTYYWTAHFALTHITWLKPNKEHLRIPEWSDAAWYCDGQEAEVVDQGDPTGGGISIRCRQQEENGIISYISVYNYTYYVHDHVQCELQHSLKEPLSIHDNEVVAAVLVYKMQLHRAIEWVEYHRLIGISHFYIYVMDENLDDWWPDLDYITYVPWNLNPKMDTSFDIFLHQMAAQVNALHRGRALGHEWVTFNDVDEYLVLQGNKTLQSYLLDHRDRVSAIQGETVTFGNQPEVTVHQEMVLNYTWRSNLPYGNSRSKCLVRPSLVDYYIVHWVTGRAGGPVHKANPWNELWFHHYKIPEKGVYTRELPDNVGLTEDTSLRNKYLATVKGQVDNILSWKDKAELDKLPEQK